MNIIPAIIPDSIEEINSKVSKMLDVVDTFQVDVVDGVLAGEASWPFNQNIALDYLFEMEETFPYLERMKYEIDIMAKNSWQYFGVFCGLGGRRIILHYQVGQEEEILGFLESIDRETREAIEVILALEHDKDLSILQKAVPLIDGVQVMGIETIGLQGQKFSEKTYDIVSEIKSIYRDITISVDGGVSEENIEKLKEFGVSRFVMGSAIWNKENEVEFVKSLL
ncbi:hypothetical protein KC842_00605 [Candidatus Nomurabacteria bacterium]|nr:hypothetical protein [Candidatus Nomurabacteria bacterium]